MGNEITVVDGIAAKTRRMRKQIDDAVRDDEACVLITGPTGVGKELVAREIHHRSRGGAVYLVVNLTDRAETRLKSDLFGHERGAFTGADERHTGFFQEAGKGSLCLDELGELPLALQPMLLRAVEQRRFRPMGAKSDLPLEARVLAATNRDLHSESVAGRFRSDLYYRIAQHVVHVPSLDERREDIRGIARSLAPTLELTEDAWRVVENRPYPGNVRQLKRDLQRIALECEARKSRRVDTDLLRDLDGEEPGIDRAEALAQYALRLNATAADLAKARRRYFEIQLEKCDGNRSDAAAAVGMPRTSFRRALGE